MRRVLMISALLAGVMAFGSMPASAGINARVDVRFGRPAPVVYTSEPQGYYQASEYVDANAGCENQGVRYGDARWNSRSHFGREQFQREQFQGRHGMHRNNGRGQGWDKRDGRDGRDQGSRQGHGDGRWGDGN